jgi:hypothetical protein
VVGGGCSPSACRRCGSRANVGSGRHDLADADEPQFGCCHRSSL